MDHNLLQDMYFDLLTKREKAMDYYNKTKEKNPYAKVVPFEVWFIDRDINRILSEAGTNVKMEVLVSRYKDRKKAEDRVEKEDMRKENEELKKRAEDSLALHIAEIKIKQELKKELESMREEIAKFKREELEQTVRTAQARKKHTEADDDNERVSWRKCV